MDNFGSDHHRFDMQGTWPKLGLMLSFAYQEFYGHAKQARYYMEEYRDGKPPRLILFWNEDPNMTMYPIFKMDAGASQTFVRAWLESLEPEAAGDEPRTDGSTEVGVRVYNEKWGHVAQSFYAFVAIEPVWLVFGK